MSEELVVELKKQNRLLMGLLVASSSTLGVLLLTAATTDNRPARFAEIDVERINVITADGRKEMVIANRDRIPDPIIEGKQVVRSGPKRPGLVFYNSVGDENGGLIFDGKLDDKGRPLAGMHFSMDRFDGDQRLSLGHYETNGTMESGLKLYDRGLAKEYGPVREAYENAAPEPEKDALFKRWKDAGGQQTNRLFVGKTRGQSSAVILADASGKARIMMVVKHDGKVIQRLPSDRQETGR